MLPVAKLFKHDGVFAIPNICVTSHMIMLLSNNLYAKMQTTIRLTIVHTHSSGYIRKIRLTKKSFRFFDLSYDAAIRNPLMENRTTTPGKKDTTPLRICINDEFSADK